MSEEEIPIEYYLTKNEEVVKFVKYDELDKYKKVLDKIKEYIENTDDFDIEIFDENSGGCLGTDLSKGAKHILEMIEETK